MVFPDRALAHRVGRVNAVVVRSLGGALGAALTWLELDGGGGVAVTGGAGNRINRAIGLGFDHSIKLAKIMVTGLKQILTGERSIKDMGGPLKIAKYSGEKLSLGPLPFVEFAALISLNLAFINLLPIPALDGGHLAFYAAEAVRKKPVGPQATEWAYRTGIAIVLMLMVVVTFNDLVSLPIFGS